VNVTNVGSTVYQGDGVSGIYVWGAQIEASPTATTYTPTTSAAVYGPRFDYNPNQITQQNLYTYSNDLSNVIWNNPSSVKSSGQSAPDGSSTAVLFTPTATSTTHNFIQTLVLTGTYTVSIYAKANGYSTVYLANGAQTSGGNFSLSAGTATPVGSAPVSITSVGNGWYRLSTTIVLNLEAPYFFINSLATYSGDGLSGIYFWGPQISSGSTLLPYLPTTSTAQTISAPAASGLLIEEARTNLAFPSQTISGWTSSGSATVVDNSGVAPDGTTTASLITPGAIGTGYYKVFSGTASGTTYAGSVYIKSLTSTSISVGTDLNVASPAYYSFNPQTGAFSSVGAGVISYGATNVGNGWWRLYWTFVSNNTTNDILLYGQVASVAFYAWGAQLEAGGFPTSYIPTTTAAVGRNADTLSIPTSSWFNSSQGTFVATGDSSYSGSSGPPIAEFNDGTASNRYLLQFGSGANSDRFLVFVSGSAVVSTLNFSSTTPYKFAGSYSAGTYSAGHNGSTSSVAYASIISGITTLQLGSSQGGGWIDGHIRSFAYYKNAFTTAQLQSITT
jgi:hypothetical protein